MNFRDMFNLIIGEDNTAGGGDVFGPGSVNTGQSMQGDNIYNPGDYRLATGRGVVSRRGAVGGRRKRRGDRGRRRSKNRRRVK